MKGTSYVTLILTGFVLTACQPAEETAAPEVEAPPVAGPVESSLPPVPGTPQTTTQASLVSDPEWAVLFAGHDLASFDSLGDAQWNIIDDYVEADGYTGSFLVSKGGYTDFRLQVEFYPGPDSNSGIFIRCADPAAVAATSCYEVNIFDTNENPDNRTGSIVNYQAPLVTSMANEQWNLYDIVAEGSSITVTLNGMVTAQIDDDSYPSGPFALQNNGGLIRFRNVRLQPL